MLLGGFLFLHTYRFVSENHTNADVSLRRYTRPCAQLDLLSCPSLQGRHELEVAKHHVGLNLDCISLNEKRHKGSIKAGKDRGSGGWPFMCHHHRYMGKASMTESVTGLSPASLLSIKGF